MTQEAFNNMIYDYYQQNSKFDIYEEKDAVYLVADLAERVSRFIVDFIEGGVYGDEEYYTLTPKGIALYEQLRNDKIKRHDDLMEKYHNFTITVEEYEELLELKKE